MTAPPSLSYLIYRDLRIAERYLWVSLVYTGDAKNEMIHEALKQLTKARERLHA